MDRGKSLKKYETVNRVLAAAEDEFETEVELDVSIPSDGDISFTWPSKVTIRWAFELEARSWGIKSIYLGLRTKELAISYQEWTEEDDIDHEVNLDLQKAEGEDQYDRGDSDSFGQIRPESLHLQLAGDPQKPETLVCESYILTWQV